MRLVGMRALPLKKLVHLVVCFFRKYEMKCEDFVSIGSQLPFGLALARIMFKLIFF
jgi:hypothetical protein